MYESGYDRKPWWISDDLFFELWPSPSEIEYSHEDDIYLGGLYAFFKSQEELQKDIFQSGFYMRWYTNKSLEKGKPVVRFAPPTISEFFIWLETAGIVPGTAIALYKVLELWVKKANGRKIKVKFDDFEIEATQLTEKQFEELLEKVVELKKNMKPVDVEKELSAYPIKRSYAYSKEKGLLGKIHGAVLERLRYPKQKELNQIDVTTNPISKGEEDGPN